VLPTAIYDLTLQPNPKDSSNELVPEVRGIRLVKALTQAPEAGYDPHVTTIVTDEVRPQQQDDTDMFVRGVWLPEQPYVHQRIARQTPAGEVPTDLLALTLAQFRASTAKSGELRRFQQMVFEVSYIDPWSAPDAVMQDSLPPLVQDIDIRLVQPRAGTPSIQATSATAQVTATVSDDGGGLKSVSMTYTTDGRTWESQALTGSGGTFTGSITLPSGPASLFVVVEAVDTAGNVTVETAKGQLQLRQLGLPLIGR
jgi:hypothetical protein